MVSAIFQWFSVIIFSKLNHPCKIHNNFWFFFLKLQVYTLFLSSFFDYFWMLFFVYFTEWGWWRGRDNKETVIRLLFVTSTSQWRMCRQSVKCMETRRTKGLSLLPTVSQGIFYLSTAKWGSKSSMNLSSKVILDFDIVQ